MNFSKDYSDLVSRSKIPFHEFELFLQDQANLTLGKVLPLEYCEICKFYKPLRSYHCSICNKCSVLMDHHCMFMNRCVNLGNIFYFIRGLCIGSLHCLLTYLSLNFLTAFSNTSFFLNFMKIWYQVFLYMSGMFAMWGCYTLSKGWTSIECMKVFERGNISFARSEHKVKN